MVDSKHKTIEPTFSEKDLPKKALEGSRLEFQSYERWNVHQLETKLSTNTRPNPNLVSEPSQITSGHLRQVAYNRPTQQCRNFSLNFSRKELRSRRNAIFLGNAMNIINSSKPLICTKRNTKCFFETCSGSLMDKCRVRKTSAAIRFMQWLLFR